MRDGTETHAMRGLRRERRTPAAGAEKHEALVLREDRLVVGARGVDPEFEHAARTMKRAGHAPLAVKLADVAHVDEGDVVTPVKGNGLVDRQGLDLALGFVDERAVAVLDLLRHGAVRPDTCPRSLAKTGSAWPRPYHRRRRYGKVESVAARGGDAPNSLSARR